MASFSMAGPDAEFRHPRRIILLNTLKTAVGQNVPQTVWACLWLSDIDILEGLVTRAKVDSYAAYSTFLNIETNVKIVQKWTQRERPHSVASTPQTSTPLQLPISQPSPIQQESPPSQSASYDLKRKLGSEGQPVAPRLKVAIELCRERDEGRCVVTKTGQPVEVAHIYPFSMRNLKESPPPDLTSIWATLRFFWSQDRVDSWYKAIFPVGTEVVSNLLCLCPNAHAYHGRTYFALQPKAISKDKKKLTAVFFWLPQYQRNSRVDILQTPIIPESLNQGPDVKLWNFYNDQKICSGDEINLETKDPEKLPLPDWRLLDMQWILHRVAALSGAAEPQDDDDQGNDDDDGCGMALEDEEDLDELALESPFRLSPPAPFYPSAEVITTLSTTVVEDSIAGAEAKKQEMIGRQAEPAPTRKVDQGEGGIGWP